MASSALGPRRFTCWAVVTCLTLIPAVRTQQSTSPSTPTTVDPSTSTSTSSTADCFSSSYVVGSVLGTFFATGIGLGLFFCLLWWICERRRRRTLSDDGTNKSARAVESGDGTGFDNPCFEGHPQSDVVDGSSSKTTNNGEDERKDIVKSTSWTPLRFFGTNRSEKKRSLDDSFISEPERVSVQLRGHDFTGLGFNVTGNMRDGIFIKDILNRGPAFESGKIAQGDRILSVTISFRHVVYEDALTILSYASPYDVTMELEKGQQRNNSITRLLSSKQQRIKAASSVSLGAASLSASSSSTAAVALSGSISPDGAPSNERLVHPLYRSQSIDDLSKVGRADTSVRADIRIPQLGGSLFKSKLVGKASPGVEVDLPEVKMKLPKASAVVDVGDINIAPLDASLVEPKTSKFAKFGIKVLPDFKFNKTVKNAELTMTDLPTGLVAPEAELTLPKVEIHTPAKSSNVAIDIDLIDGPSLPNAAGDTSIAIEMPEFQSPSVSMGVPDVNLDIDAPFASLSSDSQSGPQFNVKAPQVEIDMPDVSISQTLPDTDLSVKEIKSGFHMKFPKFGGSSGTKSVKVDLPEAEISAPTVDATLPDVPKIESSGGKAGFEFKMPKLSMKKQQKSTDVNLDVKVQPPTVDLPEVSVDVKGPSGSSIDIEAPSVELPSVSVEAKKTKMAFSMPKWNLGKGQVDVKEPSAELNLEVPSAQLDVTAPTVVLSDDDEHEGGKKKSKFSLKMPKKPKVPKGDIDVNIALPKVSAEVSQDETTDADDEDGTSSPKKKTGKIKMKIPKPPKAEVNVDLSLPSVDSKEDSDVDGLGTKKKTKFGLKMPKMSKGEIDVTLPKVEMKQHDESDDDEDTAATKKKSKFGFKMPRMSKGEVDVNLPSASVELAGQSETDDDAENGASKKGKIGIKMPKIPKAEMDVNLDLPKVSAEVKTENETDDDASGKKKTSTSKFSLKMPKIPKGDVDVNISMPKVNAEIKPVHSTEEMSDDEATGVKKKSKFNIKMPKIPKGEVDVNLAAPKVSVETSANKAAEDTSDDEVNGATSTKKKSTKFSLKMPKWNVNKPQTELMALEGVEGKIQMGTEVDLSSEMRMSDIGSDEDDEGNKKRGKFNIKMPKFGMNKPQVQLEGPDVSAEVVAELPKVQLEAPSLSIAPELEAAGKIEVSKKKSKFGFKMPKLGATANVPDLEVEGGVSKEVNVEVPNVDVKMNLESSSEDEDATTTSDDTGEKKKKRFHLKMPKFGGATKAQLEAELPKIEVEAGAASVDLPEFKLVKKPLEVEVALPNLSTDLSATVQSSDDESKKSKIDLKLPKLEMNIPDAKLDISATKSSDGNSSDDDENESKKKFGLKMPKFGMSGKVDKEVPESSINVTDVAASIDTKESKKKGTKFGIKLPGLHFDKPHVEVSGDVPDSDSDSSDDEKGANIGVKLPKIGLNKPTVEIDAPGQDLTLQGEIKAPKLDVRGDIELPVVKLDSELKTTKMDLEIADVSDGEGGDKKKKSSSNKFSIKMPKFHMKSKKTHDLDVEVAAATDVGLDIDVAGGHTDDEHSDDEKKRGGKFSIKMPKFGLKKPHVDVELPSISKTVSAEGEIDIPNVDVGIDVKDGDQQKKALFQVDMPSVSMEKPEIDLNLPIIEIKQPKIDVAINEPSLQIESAGAASSDVSLNVDLPKIPSVEVEAGAVHLKKKSKFGIDIGKMGFNKPSVEAKPGSEMPSTDVGLSASIDVPKVDVDTDLSALDDDKKKSSKFNFKMPKFHMGKPHGAVDAKVDLPSVEADVTIPEPSAKLEIDLPSVDLSTKVDDGAESDDDKKDSKKKSRFGIKMPKFQMNKPHASGVEIKTEQDLNLGADVTVELPELSSVEINTMDQELSTELDVNLPKADVELNIPGVQLQEKEGKSKKGKFSFKMPKAPQLHGGGKIAVDVPAIKTQIDAPQVDIPDVEMKMETGKKSPFIVKMPELNMGKADIELNLPKTKTELDSDDSSSEDEKDDTKKKIKLGFKMPHFGMGGKADATSSLELEAPSIEVGAAIPNPELSINTDVDVKKKSKFGFKMPSMSMPKTQVDVDAPSIESSDIRIEPPSVGLEIQHGLEGGAEATEEIDDDETKKTGGQHKFGIKMPKFHLRQRGADVILPQVELKAEALDEIASPVVEEEIKVEVKKPKFGIKLPAMPELSKPKIDVEISKKEAIHMEVDPVDVGIEVNKPTIEDLPDVNVTTGNIDAEVAKVKAQLAQLQAEFDVQSGKQEDVTIVNSSSDSEEEKKTKSSGFSLKMPKFSIGKDKHGAGAEVKLDAQLPTVAIKHTGDEAISPPSSLEVEPVKLESSGGEKEKKKFSIKMPKFQSKTSASVAVEGDTSPPDIEPKAFKINLKPTKIKDKKKKRDESSDRSDAEGDDEEETRGELSAAASSKLMDVEVKLPRVQVYKNVEYHDAEKEHHHESSSDEEDEVKDIKKNIGARFGVKLKKPKMFSSSKVEISGKADPANTSAAAAALQPEWKLPRVDLRRTSKTMDQELTVDVDLDATNSKLEQLSPSERADAIRRDAKSSAGIRLHSPSYISQMMPSPRSKKSSLEMLDVESSPRLLSVTRLDPTPPIESSASTQPVYSTAGVQLTASVTAPQVSVSDIPSSILMASEAVKIKRGPPTPARRSIIDPNSSVFKASIPVIEQDVPVMSCEASVVASIELKTEPVLKDGHEKQEQQTSDTDISVTTSTGSDTLVISPPSTSTQQEGSNRKASSLGDLTRIPPSGGEDGSLERTVSLDFKPVASMPGGQSRAIYNLAVHDLSRVGEDSDEDYNLNRKRSNNYDQDDLAEDVEISSDVAEVIISAEHQDEEEKPSLSLELPDLTSKTILTIDSDGDITMQPSENVSAEALWFGSTSIQTVESVVQEGVNISYKAQLEESISTDVTLTSNSLGTSPSETSSSSSSDGSEGSPLSPASPEPGNNDMNITPDLIIHQGENGGGNQPYHTEMTEITHEEITTTTTISRTITMELTSPDDPMPQPLTDLNPSAGSFAAVRNRFEQLSGTNVNGAETTMTTVGGSSPSTRPLSQSGSVVKRLSGNFEDPALMQKSFVQHMAPEVSEGALSRTVIISSLQLDRSEQNSSINTPTSIGPESPVPNLEPPC